MVALLDVVLRVAVANENVAIAVVVEIDQPTAPVDVRRATRRRVRGRLASSNVPLPRLRKRIGHCPW